MLRWEGCEKSPRFRNGDKWKSPLFPGINTVSDINFLKKYFTDLGESFPESDYEAFEKGELCFVLGKTVSETDFRTGEVIEIPDETLQDNDLVTIYTKASPEGLQIPVRIVENDSFIWKYYYYENRAELPVYISESTAEALRQMETPLQEFRKNRFLFRFDSLSTYEGTDKVLAAFAAGYTHSEYINIAESKRYMFRENVLRPLLVFGSLFLMSFSVFLILQHNFAEIRARRNLESIRRFLRIGMQKETLRKSLLLSEIREAAPVLSGLIAGLIWKVFSSLVYWKNTLGGAHQASTFCSLTKRYTDNPYLMTADDMLSMNTLLTVLVILIIFAGLAFFSYRVSCRLYEKEDAL